MDVEAIASSPTSTARVRLTFLITELDDGGAERAFVQIVTGLNPERWERHVICLGPRGVLAEPLERAGIEVVSLNVRPRAGPMQSADNATASPNRSLPSASRVKAFVKLVQVLKHQRPTILQTFLYHANIAGRLAARLAGVPHVVSGIRVAERRSQWRLRCDRWTECLVDRHICVSQAVADFSVRESGLSAAKVAVVPNGVDYERFHSAVPADLTQFGLSPNGPVVLFVGRLDNQKDPGTLLTAFAKVIANYPRAQLLIVGRGALEKALRREVARLGLADHVRFAGWQTDVAGIMKACDVLVSSSRWEGMPNVLLEAAAAALPIVATRAEGTSELLNDGTAGEFVGIGDVDAIAAAVVRVLDDLVSAKERAKRLQVIVHERFTWGNVVARYDQVYESLLRPRC